MFPSDLHSVTDLYPMMLVMALVVVVVLLLLLLLASGGPKPEVDIAVSAVQIGAGRNCSKHPMGGVTGTRC